MQQKPNGTPTVTGCQTISVKNPYGQTGASIDGAMNGRAAGTPCRPIGDCYYGGRHRIARAPTDGEPAAATIPLNDLGVINRHRQNTHRGVMRQASARTAAV